MLFRSKTTEIYTSSYTLSLHDALPISLRSAEQQAQAVLEEGFWSAPERTHPLPRNRRNAALSLRRCDRIAPHEYRLAVLQVVKAAVGIDRKDLIVETARLLGFDRTGTDLQAAIDEQISVLIKSNRICADNGHIRGSPDPDS